MESLLPGSFKIPIKYNNKNFRTKETNRYFKYKENECRQFKKNELNLVKQCVACKKKKKKLFIKKFLFKYVKCENCNHVYLENPINKKKIEYLYKYSQADKLSRLRKNNKSPYSKYFLLLYQKYFKIISFFSPKNTNLIDIGCGDGHFIEFLKKKNYYNLFANEIASSEEKKLKQMLGKNFFYKSLDKINLKKTVFHTVTMWGVLEHVTNVDLTFSLIKKILHKDGIFFFWIPNINSYAFKILKENTPAVSPRDHLNFFNYEAIEHLCKRHNFHIIDFFQECPIIDLMYPAIDFNQKLYRDIIKKKQCYYHIYILKKN